MAVDCVREREYCCTNLYYTICSVGENAEEYLLSPDKPGPAVKCVLKLVYQRPGDVNVKVYTFNIYLKNRMRTNREIRITLI